MTDAQIRMECSSCGKRVPFMSMNYGKDGNSLLCEACFGKENPKKEVSDTKDKEKYICNACSFKFSFKKDKKNIACPYCGKKDFKLVSALSADNLIKESILDDM